MGNSIQKKKKVEAEAHYSASSSLSPAREKPKGFWLFGRTDKVRTGKRSTGCVGGGLFFFSCLLNLSCFECE